MNLEGTYCKLIGFKAVILPHTRKLISSLLIIENHDYYETKSINKILQNKTKFKYVLVVDSSNSYTE